MFTVLQGISTAGGGLPDQGTVTQEMLVPNALDATVVGNATADAVIGALPILYPIDIPDGGGDKDVIVAHKIRVIDAWLRKILPGNAGNSFTVKNGTQAITNGMNNASDNGVARATIISDAFGEIAEGGTLRVTSVLAGGATNAVVYVLAVRVA